MPNRTNQSRTARPPPGRATLAEFLVQLWRAKLLMVLVFALIALIGVLIATRMPSTYRAETRLYIAGVSETEAVASVVRSEIELMKSLAVSKEVVMRFGLARLYPRQAMAAGLSPQSLLALGAERVRADFSAHPAGDSRVVRVAYRNRDAALAADVLNALIGGYIAHRSEVLAKAAPTDQRRALEAELLAAEGALRQFLDDKGVDDFVAERASARALSALINDELVRAAGEEASISAERAAVSARLTETPRTVVGADEALSGPIGRLEAERDDLLTRYKPDARPVVAIEQRIERARAAVSTETAAPNPAYAALEGALAELDLRADVQAAEMFELQRQHQVLQARLAKFASLEAEWRALTRRRDALEGQLALTGVGQSSAGADRADLDAVRVLDPVVVKGPPRRRAWLIVWLGVGLGAFAAFGAGVARAGSARGVATARGLERATGLPVVASARAT
ncbi:MAG: Wzz/FepE/Etk N-terminal domain-containing protein [Pseudomonadota bacterium]